LKCASQADIIGAQIKGYQVDEQVGRRQALSKYKLSSPPGWSF
jgi:hypothetical protein